MTDEERELVAALRSFLSQYHDFSHSSTARVRGRCETCAALARAEAWLAEKQVGCERDDGTLNIHAAQESCDVCRPAGPAPEEEK